MHKQECKIDCQKRGQACVANGIDDIVRLVYNYERESDSYLDKRAHPMKRWSHPGGRLRELGAEALTDAQLLAILISTGIKGRSAQQIADEIVERYGSLSGMANVPLERFLEFKGLSDVKIIRIAAAFEIARRLSREALSYEEEK